VSADIIVIEEAAHINPKVFKKIILPLMSVTHTAVIAISTPEDENDYMNMLMELQWPNGEYIFLSLRIGFGKKNPVWRGVGNQRKVNAIYKCYGETELGEREASGVLNTGKHYHFSRDSIEKLRVRGWQHTFDREVNVLHMAIDPAGGGKSSDFAVTTITYTRDHKGRQQAVVRQFIIHIYIL